MTGLKLSAKSKSDYVFSAGGNSSTIPSRYSYKRFLPSVIDQGADPICVPCTLSAYLNWRENLKNGSKKDNRIDYYELYESKTSEGEGMTFKEAFKYLRHNGVDSKAGQLKIGTYSKVGSSILLKYAILLNGPCMGALPMYNESEKFWEQNAGDYLRGYHAISIVGYDDKGFIIRNSWGIGYGDNGYSHIPEKDFKKFIELWTVSD